MRLIQRDAASSINRETLIRFLSEANTFLGDTAIDRRNETSNGQSRVILIIYIVLKYRLLMCVRISELYESFEITLVCAWDCSSRFARMSVGCFERFAIILDEVLKVTNTIRRSIYCATHAVVKEVLSTPSVCFPNKTYITVNPYDDIFFSVKNMYSLKNHRWF